MKKILFLTLVCGWLRASDTLLIKYYQKGNWFDGYLITETSKIVEDVLLVYTHPLSFLTYDKQPMERPKYFHFVFPALKK